MWRASATIWVRPTIALGNYATAIKYYELALACSLKADGEAYPDVAMDRNNLGVAYHDLCDDSKAIEYYRAALNTFKEKLGDNHPYTKGRQSYLQSAIEAQSRQGIE